MRWPRGSGGCSSPHYEVPEHPKQPRTRTPNRNHVPAHRRGILPRSCRERPVWKSSTNVLLRRILVVAARCGEVRSQTDLPTLALARQPFLGQGLRVIATSR
jgi:hypothetical protein